jgi:hypothetical protein
MRLPNSAHEAGHWRIRAIAPDFTVEDVWALPAQGQAQDFDRLVKIAVSSDPARVESGPARALWSLRDRLGGWFGLGRISEETGSAELPIPGTNETSLSGRLPDDLRGTATGLTFASLPFEPLYRTDDEFAAEISNRTVHGVMHLAWAERGEGDYQGQMAVYVKPRGSLGKGYMALIRPFRHWIVYPALMRQIERAWARRAR